jgi:hypothetical protein
MRSINGRFGTKRISKQIFVLSKKVYYEHIEDIVSKPSCNYSYWRQYPFRLNEPYCPNYWPRNFYFLRPSKKSSQRDDFPKIKSFIRKHN